VIDGASPETTGKFGTGFLTTHLLSRIVEVSGIYINFYNPTLHHKFSITLDRSPRTKPAMIAKYKETFARIRTFNNHQVCPLVENY
jgi:hypothetical protein